MSHHKFQTQARCSEAGFGLVELMITIALIATLSVTFMVFFRTSLFSYLDLQKDATGFTDLDHQVSRVSNVLRGTTQVVSAGANELVVYAYFYPSDTYVSHLRYYVVTTGSKKQLKADLTPMTANPPLGTQITAQMRTFTLIDDLYQPSGGTLFTYLSSAGSAIPLPIGDLISIKGIRVTMSTQTVAAGGGDQTMELQVTLRNRKTNL
ncbi:hypothetical protein IPL85_01245 [Candidatus Saccharibacteria bacterium]|nr:MAG: hypothetical protein IPL85_01245 [Candidatus Saccharibacteria bacterium]